MKSKYRQLLLTAYGQIHALLSEPFPTSKESDQAIAETLDLLVDTIMEIRKVFKESM